MSYPAVWALIRDSVLKWWKDDALRLGAALAFYTMISLAPLLVIVTAIAGLWFSQEAVREQVVGEVNTLTGSQGAAAVKMLLENASYERGANVFATLVGLGMLLIGATAVFVELQNDLNAIWDVKPKEGEGLMAAVRERLLSFAAVLGLAFLLLVSLIVSAVLTALGNYFGEFWPDYQAVLKVLNFVVSVVVIAVIFALIFRILPDAKIAWGDVWVGAAVTGLLFTVGKDVIGWYLGSSGIGSAYGAAGSLAVFLLWVYYSTQILFLGAEFTQVYANRYGSAIVPEDKAETNRPADKE